MSDIWAPVVAALGASLLTGFFGFGLEWWREWKAGKATLAERRSRAYSTLLARSASLMQLASNFHNIMELRSGLREGLNVTLGIQKPLDPMELAKWMATEFQPVYDAWSEVWAIGSQEAIAGANDLLTECGTVMGTATRPGQARPAWLQSILGQKWTQEQLDQWQADLRSLGEARRLFSAIARKESGVEVADLFSSNESKPPSNAKELSAVGQPADENQR